MSFSSSLPFFHCFCQHRRHHSWSSAASHREALHLLGNTTDLSLVIHEAMSHLQFDIFHRKIFHHRPKSLKAQTFRQMAQAPHPNNNKNNNQDPRQSLWWHQRVEDCHLPLRHCYTLSVRSINTIHASDLKTDSHLRSMASHTTYLESMISFSPSPLPRAHLPLPHIPHAY